MRLTVGSWCDRLPGVLKNISLTWQKDYPWEIAIDGPEGGNDKQMLVLPHVLDVTVSYQPIHNFLPEKSIHSPFILPHENNRNNMRDEVKWYLPEIAKTPAEALYPLSERLKDTLGYDVPGTPNRYPVEKTVELPKRGFEMNEEGLFKTEEPTLPPLPPAPQPNN